MLATKGYIKPEITGKFPGFRDPSTKLAFADIPNGLAAVSNMPVAGRWQIFVYSDFIEVAGNIGKDIVAGTFGQLSFTAMQSARPVVL